MTEFGELTGLPSRARWLFYIQAAMRLGLFWVPVTGIAVTAGGALWSVANSAAIGAVWLFFLFLLAVWMPTLTWQRYGYALRQDALIIARGVLVRSVTGIPTNRIQHVDIRQGPVEQWMGLARLQIHTASGMGADGSIPGLEVATAEALRDELVDVEGDDGV